MQITDTPSGFKVTDGGAVASVERVSKANFQIVILYVPAAMRRQGVGTALCMAAKDEAERRGVPLLRNTRTGEYGNKIGDKMFGSAPTL